jgi:hypothetical protein
MEPSAPIHPAAPVPATWHCESCNSTKVQDTSNFYAVGKGFRKTCIPCSVSRQEHVQKRLRAAKVAKEDDEKEQHTKWDDSQQSPEKKRQRLDGARQARRDRALSRNNLGLNTANAPQTSAPLPLLPHSPNPTPRIPQPNVANEPEPEPEPYLDPVGKGSRTSMTRLTHIRWRFAVAARKGGLR